MKITPLDVRQKQFPGKFRGLDPKPVQDYLELLSNEFEELVRESITLKDEIKKRGARLEEYREREKTLQETMVTAQKASNDIKEAASRQSEIIIAEAELQAERIVQGAHTRLVQILDEIGELKRQRAQFEAGVRTLVEAELKLLEVFQSQSGPHLPENIEFLSQKGRDPEREEPSERRQGLTRP